MKKQILFVIDSLDVAGSEKSLISLLSLLDFNEYSVDLQLFQHGHMLEKLVPKEVNVLKPIKYTTFTNLKLNKAILYSVRNFKYKMLSSRLKFSIKVRGKQFTNRQKSRIYWQNSCDVIDRPLQKYDIAISYSQGIPTFYVADKVDAVKKFTWVNVSYKLDDMEKSFQKPFYDKYNKIVAVSDSTKEILLKTFPEYSTDIEVIYDINNPKSISNMAEIGKSYQDNFSGIRLLTIGRLDHQKGYDIALEACENLKKQGINFRWYVLGKGPLKQEIENEIRKNELSEHFILLGVEANPYPFIKNSDIYVQTSKFEGFGLAIAEARMLNIPVVTTEFDAVYNQMKQKKNGLVVDMNGESVCNGILELINNMQLKQEIITYLQQEKKGNVEELDRFYKLVN
ncbi:glycosyltransferase [Salipaludibacillus sp. HK11]|uniref:glycosyltransferase n=1 Tax=Salipaludibacillus sp. HK11 TaxID=3394320 RepID=UPI0039FBF61C